LNAHLSTNALRRDFGKAAGVEFGKKSKQVTVTFTHRVLRKGDCHFG